jgi:hypothetical protein
MRDLKKEQLIEQRSKSLKQNVGLALSISECYQIIKIVVNEALNLPCVVRSVYTIYSTAEDAIVKIVDNKDAAKKEVETFKAQHRYADFFYEEVILS